MDEIRDEITWFEFKKTDRKEEKTTFVLLYKQWHDATSFSIPQEIKNGSGQTAHSICEIKKVFFKILVWIRQDRTIMR